MRKLQILLALCILALMVLISNVSAIVTYAEWQNGAKSITINQGNSVNFNATFASVNPPMTISIKLYDSNYNLVSTIEETTINNDIYYSTYTIDSSDYVTFGNFNVIIIGRDRLGSYTSTLQLSVLEADTTPPTITITYPVNGGLYDGNNINVQYTVTDNKDPLNSLSCSYNLDGTNTSLPSCSGFTIFSPTNGTHTLTVYSRDTSNNIGSNSVTFNVDTSLDLTPPTITIDYPLNGILYDSHITELNYTIIGNTLDSCWYSLNGMANVTTTCGQDITGITSVEGVNTWLVYVNDTSGNIGFDIVMFTVNTSLDFTAPKVTITYPEDNKIYSDVSSLKYTVSDPNLNSCWYSLDNGKTNITTTCGQDITGINNLDEGIYTWIVYADDTVGYIGFDVVTFVISQEKKKDETPGWDLVIEDAFGEQEYLDQFAEKQIITLDKDKRVLPSQLTPWVILSAFLGVMIIIVAVLAIKIVR